MKNVIFVAPYFLDATERFIAAAASLPDVRLGLVSCDAEAKLKPGIRSRLACHYAVPSIETDDLLRGVLALREQLGGVDCLLGMLEQIQVGLGEIRDRLGIPGMGAEVAHNFRDKSRMKNVLRNAGIPCTRHRLAADEATALEFSREVGFPLVVKPPDGAGAKGTFRCENADQLLGAVRSLRPTPQQPALLEEFITGIEHSYDSVFVGGRSVWYSISHYFPGPLEVLREPWIQWCVIIPRESQHPRYEGIIECGPRAIAALGLRTGLSHLEWFRRPDGSIAVSEVGARPPGAQFTSLLSYAHDFDFYRGWAELLIFERFAPPAQVRLRSGVPPRDGAGENRPCARGRGGRGGTGFSDRRSQAATNRTKPLQLVRRGWVHHRAPPGNSRR